MHCLVVLREKAGQAITDTELFGQEQNGVGEHFADPKLLWQLRLGAVNFMVPCIVFVNTSVFLAGKKIAILFWGGDLPLKNTLITFKITELLILVIFKLLQMLLSKLQKISFRNHNGLSDIFTTLLEELPWVFSCGTLIIWSTKSLGLYLLIHLYIEYYQSLEKTYLTKLRAG